MKSLSLIKREQAASVFPRWLYHFLLPDPTRPLRTLHSIPLLSLLYFSVSHSPLVSSLISSVQSAPQWRTGNCFSHPHLFDFLDTPLLEQQEQKLTLFLNIVTLNACKRSLSCWMSCTLAESQVTASCRCKCRQQQVKKTVVLKGSSCFSSWNLVEQPHMIEVSKKALQSSRKQHIQRSVYSLPQELLVLAYG